ncbi:MAG: SIS domain-containing protein [Patescibacteria group bacterium]
MNILDDQKAMKKLDRSNMLGSIESVGLQCQQAWSEVKKVKIPLTCRRVKNIVINGMGGSALGGHVIAAIFHKQLRVPFHVINSYTLPGWVNRDTLYVLSSYSGTTEEVLATFNEARRRHTKLLIICAGGQLAKLAKKYKIPAYIFEPRFNPCNQPRMGLGYSIIGQVALLKQCGLLSITENDFQCAVGAVHVWHKKFGAKTLLKKNPAKKLAVELAGRIPIIMAAEHLSGNAHILANQINENAKTFSAYYLLSELNHHLMEGLHFPRANRKMLHFVSLESSGYLPSMTKRFAITKKVLQKNGIKFFTYKTQGQTPLAEVMEALLFGSYANYYLALANKLDPSPILFVDYFKAALKR